MTSSQKITDPIAFFVDRGFLHDAEVINVSCKVSEKIIEININDLNAAFFELPNYGTTQPALLIFGDATSFYANIGFEDDIVISKAHSFRDTHGFICDFQLRYGGLNDNINGASLRIVFQSMSFTPLG
jgi:hypothetical protein